MENLPAREAVFLFEVLRCDDLMRQDQLRQIRSVLRERLHDCLAQGFSLRFPIALQLIRRVLHVDRHHMFALGSKRRIGKRRNRGFEIWLTRESAILRIVKSALQIVDLVADMDAPP